MPLSKVKPLMSVLVVGTLLAACTSAAPTPSAAPTSSAAPTAAPRPTATLAPARSGETSAAGTGLKLVAAAAPARLPAPESLVNAARTEGGLLWYESTPDQQVQPVLDAFKKAYPFVEQAQHVRIVGGNDMAVRILQETQAGQLTADVGTNSADIALELTKRQLLGDADWVSLGIPRELTPEPHLVATTASIYVIIYNTDLVKDDEAPRNWEDLLNPKWQGKLGTWVRANAFSSLVPVWGFEKTTDYVKKFAAQSPRTFESTFTLAQAVGAGELPVGVGIYHATQPAIKAGAPIKIVVPEPTSLNILYSFVTRGGKSPNTARLFIHWLATEEGARAYEQATGRGNPLVPGTETAALLKGRTLSDFTPDQADEFAQWVKQHEAILRQGGR